MNSDIFKRIALLYSKSCLVQYTRGAASKLFQPARLKRETPEIYYSLKERLTALDFKLKDPERYEKVDIGFPYKEGGDLSASVRRQELKKIRADKALEKSSRNRTLLVNLDDVEADGSKSTRPFIVKNVAEHFNVFKDLFGEFAYFYPIIPMNINFDFDETSVSPVYFGNLLKPSETSSKPEVEIEDESESIWTLLLTSPDNNLYEENTEVLHWLVGNIKGNNAKKGEEVVPYLQPFPPQGTGYHRYIFTLYKQDRLIDFNDYKQDDSSYKQDLRSRNFQTYDFYKKFENVLTPAGLAFFQSDWDSSLDTFFHNKLDMRQPNYEYEFPKPYIAPQKYFPSNKAFNRYLDLHRDPKDISKDMLLKRLSKIHPFEGDLKLLPYPQAVDIDPNLPIWIKNEIREERQGSGKFKQMYKGDNRPYQFFGEKTKRPPYPIFNKSRFAPIEEDD